MSESNDVSGSGTTPEPESTTQPATPAEVSSRKRFETWIFPVVTLFLGAILGLGSAYLTNQQSIDASSNQAQSEFLRGERRTLYVEYLRQIRVVQGIVFDWANLVYVDPAEVDREALAEADRKASEALSELRNQFDEILILGDLGTTKAAYNVWMLATDAVFNRRSQGEILLAGYETNPRYIKDVDIPVGEFLDAARGSLLVEDVCINDRAEPC